MNSKIYSYLSYIFIFLCLSTLFFLLLNSALSESPVFDEPLHIAAGKAFWQHHDFRVEPFNPPLARLLTTLPIILWPSLDTPYFLASRLVVIVSTLFLAIVVYLFSKKLYGTRAAIVSLALFTFETNILTHGHYATTDMLASTFFTLTLFILWKYRRILDLKKTIIVSVVAGLALSTKLSILFYLGLATPIILLGKKLNFYKWRLLLISLLVGALSLWSTYFFTMEPALGLRTDANRPAAALAQKNPLIKLALEIPLPLGSYLSTIKQIFVYNYTSLYQKSPFLLGEFSTRGFWQYYPVAFLVKTSPVVLLFFVFSVFFSKNRSETNKRLLLVMLAIFLVTFLSKYNLGIRYILPLYPLLIIFSGQIININLGNRIQNSLGVAVFFSFLVFETLSVFPHYISYFNFFAGGSLKGYNTIVDSNTDWGQGLIALKGYQRAHPGNLIQLGYFGSVNPEEFGILYERVNDINVGNTAPIQKLDRSKTIVISETCWYYCGYYENPLLKSRQPDKIIGGSLLLFLP